MLEASPFRRSKMVKEVEILDDEIQSRYEKIHGKNGLCFALVEIFNVIRMNDAIWKIKKLDWQAVGTRIRAEETERAERKCRRLDPR